MLLEPVTEVSGHDLWQLHSKLLTKFDNCSIELKIKETLFYIFYGSLLFISLLGLEPAVTHEVAIWSRKN